MEAILCPQAFEEVLPCDMERGTGDGFYGLHVKIHPVVALANHRSFGMPKNNNKQVISDDQIEVVTMIELQILPQGITKTRGHFSKRYFFSKKQRQGAAGFLEPHPFGDLGRCDSVGSYGTVNMKSMKVKAKLPQMSFWKENCSVFFLLLRDVPISSFSFDTTHVIPVPYLQEMPILGPKA